MTDEKKSLEDRVKIREPDLIGDEATEYITTAKDRIVLYGGFSKYDDRLDSITVDVVLAMYRRKYHEGITSEGVDVFSTTFVDSLLDKYSIEFANLKRMIMIEDADEDNSGAGKLRFL